MNISHPIMIAWSFGVLMQYMRVTNLSMIKF